MKFKTVKRYEVRYNTTSGHFLTRRVGFKGTLLERKHATKVVRRLRKSGIDAYISSPLEIKVPA